MNAKGVVVQEDPSVNYDLIKYPTAHFGILYNIYQYKNWNFKSGMIFKPKAERKLLNFTKKQTGLNSDIKYQFTSSGGDFMTSVPLVAEYIVPISNSIKFSIAPSFSLSWYNDHGGGSGHVRNGAAIYAFDDDNSDKPFHASAEISAGFYFLFKHFMLHPEFRYSKSFKDIKTGYYITENYLTEPHSSKGTYKQTGDYWGLSLSLYLKKKKNNSK